MTFTTLKYMYCSNTCWKVYVNIVIFFFVRTSNAEETDNKCWFGGKCYEFLTWCTTFSWKAPSWSISKKELNENLVVKCEKAKWKLGCAGWWGILQFVSIKCWLGFNFQFDLLFLELTIQILLEEFLRHLW